VRSALLQFAAPDFAEFHEQHQAHKKEGDDRDEVFPVKLGIQHRNVLLVGMVVNGHAEFQRASYPFTSSLQETMSLSLTAPLAE
jgi:hypothetical protein